jgi:hypothetical protein
MSMESHGDDDAGRRKLLTRPPELSGRNILDDIKSYDMGPLALLPIRRKVCYGLLSPLKIHRLGWA